MLHVSHVTHLAQSPHLQELSQDVAITLQGLKFLYASLVLTYTFLKSAHKGHFRVLHGSQLKHRIIPSYKFDCLIL